MSKIKPVVARTPEELAGALGLTELEAKQWQIQHILLNYLKEIVCQQGITHADLARLYLRAAGTAIHCGAAADRAVADPGAPIPAIRSALRR
jgi:hypothetical protein